MNYLYSWHGDMFWYNSKWCLSCFCLFINIQFPPRIVFEDVGKGDIFTKQQSNIQRGGNGVNIHMQQASNKLIFSANEGGHGMQIESVLQNILRTCVIRAEVGVGVFRGLRPEA